MINKEKIAKWRREFNAAPLIAEQLPVNPHALFETWFSQVLEANIDDPTACVLATVDEKGLPDTRVVLLKDFLDEQFVFYTNYHSHKALQMKACPSVALNFYWPSLFRQVRIRGAVAQLDATASKHYFHSRPRDSQISVYASHQSCATTRAALDAAFLSYQQQFANEVLIPYPPFWGGYYVIANEIEFWHGRHHRLHDRVQYSLQNGAWTKQVLAP